MKLLTNTILTLTTLLLVACGENTTTAVVADVKSIEINSTDINMYATDTALPLVAHVNYDDGSNADVTNRVSWISSSKIVDVSSAGVLSVVENGGDSNITIEYEGLDDKIALKVAKLTSMNYSDINLSDTSNAQTIYVSGNFDNNDTNVTLNSNLLWLTDTNATISENNASTITLTLHDTQTLLYAKLLDKEVFCHPVSKKLLSINYTDINSSDINRSQVVYISANYENNESNVTLEHKITWSSDSNSTIGENNSTQFEITIYNTPTTITGTIFSGTGCDNNFTKSY